MRQHRARGPWEGCLKRKRHLMKTDFSKCYEGQVWQSPPLSSNAETSKSFPPVWKGLLSRSVLSDANKHEHGLAKGDVKELHGRHPVWKKLESPADRLHRELLNTEAVMKATRKATWIYATCCTTFHQAEKNVFEFTNVCHCLARGFHSHHLLYIMQAYECPCFMLLQLIPHHSVP